MASTSDSSDSVEMRYEDENIWLTQNMMAALYDVTVPTINYHIGQVLKDGELDEYSVIRKFLITAADCSVLQDSTLLEKTTGSMKMPRKDRPFLLKMKCTDDLSRCTCIIHQYDYMA